MQELTVVVQNDTENTDVACLYWTFSGLAWLPPVWLTTRVHWGKSASISWSPVWQFVWAQTQNLNVGTVVTAGESVDADMASSNQITLSYDAARGFSFSGLGQGPSAGRLTVNCDGTLPPQQVAVGLGMNDAPLALLMAQPYVTAQFAPPNQLWIAFPAESTQGQIVDPSAMSGAAQIVFPVNTASMTATIHADGTWSIAPTPL